jgi:hypothetical protein
MTTPTLGDAPATLTSVLARVAEVAGTPSWQLSDEQVAAVFADLEQARRLVEAAQVVVLAEAAGRGLPAQVGARTTGQWAERVVDGDCEAAHRLARRAGALYAGPASPDLGPTRDAMLAGAVSGRQVDVLVETVTALCPPACPAGVPVSALTLQTLACIGEVKAVLVDDAGHPLDVADTHRIFTPRQRAAVIARDRHCTYPGCTAPPPWCDAHHITWASRGGATTIDNAALLCGYHHRHVHRTDQTATLTAGRVVWHASARSGPDAAAARPITRADDAVRALARRWRARHADGR